MNTASFPTRRQILALGAGASFVGFASAMHAKAGMRPVVVELFTSQGCSSCPPADAFMEELKAMKGVIAISLHVDYWDYLGWRDTLGDKAYSQRQRDYARWRNDGDVYTPQMVIDGATHVVGSDRPAVRAAIKRAQAALGSTSVPIALSATDKEIAVTVEARNDGPTSTLWLIAVAPAITVKIARGENAGREIAYYNVVRKLAPVAMWSGKPIERTIPTDGFLDGQAKGCVALLQTGVGPVIGAAAWGGITA